jgi:molybdate transport system substrate-binding protein
MARNYWRAILFVPFLLAGAATLSSPVHTREAESKELLVFAAASLTDALQDLAADFEKSTGTRVKLSFAASSALARQIEAGGSAHVFVSADQEWMDYLASRDLIDRNSRRDLVGNSLVLIAPTDSSLRLQIAPGFKLAEALSGGRLALADPDTVPAGRYARAALTTLGVWNSVSNKLAPAENVRTALTYVARGESPLGVVYSTDAQIDPKVRVLATFPDSTHAPITYPAAATAGAGPGASAFLTFIGSREALVTWKKYGFRELTR